MLEQDTAPQTSSDGSGDTAELALTRKFMAVKIPHLKRNVSKGTALHGTTGRDVFLEQQRNIQ